jgi:hypothetical protein
MRKWPNRLFVLPGVLIVGLGAAACGSSSSPTAPATSPALGAGNYSLVVFGTSACLSGSGTGSGTSSASIKVELSSTAAFDVWRVSVPGQSLAGEVALVKGQLQGWLRGSAASETVRLATGATPDAALAMESTRASHGTYEGPVLVGTPRYEGIGSASGAYTTCSTNAFTLQPA